MERLRRLLGVSLFAVSALMTLALPLAAQTGGYPVKPITLIVPYPAGGSADILARSVGQKLGERLGQTVVIENRAGAGTAIGAKAVAGAAADGYTLLLGTVTSQAINPAMNKVGYDPLRDFTPFAPLASIPFVLVAHPSLPARNVAEVVALAKARPGEIGYALPHVQSGKLKALAVTGTARSALLPEVPTAIESGLTQYDVTAWFGVFAPAGLPRPVLERLNGEISALIRTPDMQKRLHDLGASPEQAGVEAYAEFGRREVSRWSEVVRKAGLAAGS